MSVDEVPFQTGGIRARECWSAGWQLVKEQYWLLVGMSAVAILLGSFAPLGILMGAMMCGLDIALLTLLRGERIEFGLLFRGFDYFVPGLIVTLVKLGAILVILIPSYVAFFLLFFVAAATGSGTRNSAAPIAILIVGGLAFFMVVLALSLTVGVLLAFTYFLIVDRKLSGWDACRTSARAARANVGGVLRLLVLNGVAGFAGALACYVGLFFVLPIQFAAMAVAYRQVFPDEGAPLMIAATRPDRTIG